MFVEYSLPFSYILIVNVILAVGIVSCLCLNQAHISLGIPNMSNIISR